jgi:hypothetical protein
MRELYDALIMLRGKAAFAVFGEAYSDILWLSPDRLKPFEEQIVAILPKVPKSKLGRIEVKAVAQF